MAASLLDQQVCDLSGIPFPDQIHHQLWSYHHHPGDIAQTGFVSVVLQVILEYGKDESAEA